MSKEKEKCEHEWARVWLASKNYVETKYCRKCWELYNASKKSRQEGT